MKWNILIFTISFVFSALIAEVMARYLFKEESPLVYSEYFDESYPTLRPPFHSQTIFKKRSNGEILYNIDFKFDSLGRRRTQEIKSSRAALFFGGSFTFGDGIESEETLPWKFAEKANYQTYNYAYSGYGPNNMLAMLYEHDLSDHISDRIRNLDIFFSSYHFHSERYLGAFRWVGSNNVNDPYFKLQKDRLVFLGNFAKARPFVTSLYWYSYHSALLRRVFGNLGDRKDSEAQALLCAIVNQAAKTAKKQLEGRLNKFYFVISPYQSTSKSLRYYEGVKRCLSRSVTILDIKSPREYLEDRGKFEIDPYKDSHPNGYANDWLAQKLVDLTK